MAPKEPLNDELITGQQSYQTLDESIGDLVLDQKRHNNKAWIGAFIAGFLILHLFLISVLWLVYTGIGTWGNNVPAAWGFDIINFVWWIGIGHAGTLISAILLLMRQQWRNSINRFAEAMTIFAVICAAQYPLLHTGRPWVAYWLFPYPNILAMWPQFRSPLIWDVFAVNTYASVSVLFWLVGLVPDFATLRDRAKNKIAKPLLGFLSFGWRGSARHWHRYEQAYLLLAGLSTPLVLSVHTIVSYDFAVSIVPGWNVTVFPPYFVAGAVFAGFAMVLILSIPIRALYNLKDLITMRHIDWMCKIMLATGLIVFYGYILEVFYAWYSGNVYELSLMNWRFNGPYALAYWMLIFLNGIVPQVLWSPAARTNLPVVWVVSMAVTVGMWLERFVIIPVSLTRNYLPSSDRLYMPTMWDFAMFFGTIGLFITLMFLFIRFAPIINIFEMKDLLHKMQSEKTRKREASSRPDELTGVGGGH